MLVSVVDSILLALQILSYALFRIAHGSHQFDLGEVVSVEAGNIAFVSRSHAFLGLDDFQVVGHSRGKAVTGLDKSLLRQVHGAERDLYLLVGCHDIQQSRTNLVFYLAAQVFQLGAVLA